MISLKQFGFLGLLGILLLGSCTTTQPFTQQIRENYKLQDDELQSLQFYTSDEIVLVRKKSSKTKETVDGSLTVSNKEELEEIIIPAETPCVVEDVLDNKKISVRFGEGKTLVFGGMVKFGGYYSLMALDWNNGRGKVRYGDKIFFTQVGASAVFLKLEMKGLKETKKTKTVEDGEVIGQ